MNNEQFSKIEELRRLEEGALGEKASDDTVIRWILLKYAADNQIGAKTKEDFECYQQLTRLFQEQFTDGGSDVIHPVLQLLEREYGVEGDYTPIVNHYAMELFGPDAEQKTGSFPVSPFKKVLAYLNEWDMTVGENNGSSLKDAVLTLNPVELPVIRLQKLMNLVLKVRPKRVSTLKTVTYRYRNGYMFDIVHDSVQETYTVFLYHEESDDKQFWCSISDDVSMEDVVRQVADNFETNDLWGDLICCKNAQNAESKKERL
jgi:hypothetical protein